MSCRSADLQVRSCHRIDNEDAGLEARAPARRVRKSRTLDRLRPLLLPTAFGASLLLLWQALVVIFGYPKVILPAPSDIFTALVDDFAMIWQQTVPTVRDTLAGFALAALFGVGLASLLSFSRLLRDAIYPLIVVIQLVPKIAWTPLFIVWVGIGWQSRLTIAAFIGFFPIFIAMMAGLESTDRSLVRLCRGLTATPWRKIGRAHV